MSAEKIQQKNKIVFFFFQLKINDILHNTWYMIIITVTGDYIMYFLLSTSMKSKHFCTVHNHNCYDFSLIYQHISVLVSV